MVIHGHKTLLVRCHICGRMRVYNLNIFGISKEEEIEYKCICGETNVSIKTMDYETYWLKLNCFACNQKHIYRYNLKELLQKDKFIFCGNKLRVCFIGKEEKAKELIDEDIVDFEKLLKRSGFDNYVENLKILGKCLKKINKLNKEGNIGCDCGSNSVVIEVFSDRVELNCLNCNSRQIIYAETEEDLEVLMRKEKILMHKHSIAYIDSIIEKNKNTKEK